MNKIGRAVVTMLSVVVLTIAGSQRCSGQAPHIAGSVAIDVQTGLIECDLTVSNIPDLEDVTLALNRGLNIRFMQVNDQSIGYNMDYGHMVTNQFMSEGIAYAPILKSGKPTSIRLKYSGAFPVYDGDPDKNHYGDSQTNIAFRNGILRASQFTKWYPVVFDRVSQSFFSDVTYDLVITTDSSARSIYINGSPPYSGNEYNAVSTEPNNLLLYVGDYNFHETGSTYFLNSPLEGTGAEGALDASLAGIRAFYNDQLGTTDSSPLVIGQIFSVGRSDQYSNWALAEYPAILANLEQLPASLTSDGSRLDDIEVFRLYAHELAHRYWGLSVKSVNEYWGFYSETLAEYFSLKAVESILGKDRYIDFLKRQYLTDRALRATYPQLDNIEPSSNTRNWYRYYPMLLVGLEQIVGMDKMMTLFRLMLAETTDYQLDYDSFRTLALESGITIADFDEFEIDFVQVPNSLPKVLSGLSSSP